MKNVKDTEQSEQEKVFPRLEKAFEEKSGIFAPSPPFENSAEDAELQLIADHNNYFPGPERIFCQVLANPGRYIKKVLDPSRPDEGIDYKIMSELQGYAKVVSINKSVEQDLKNKYGLEVERGDIIMTRRGARDFFEIAGTPFINLYILDIVNVIKKRK